MLYQNMRFLIMIEPQPNFISIARVFMPKDLFDKFLKEYIDWPNKSIRQRVAVAIDEVERRYCNPWSGDEVEIKDNGGFGKIGITEANKRNSAYPGFVVLQAVRIELGLIDNIEKVV
jgi:hypothetical protein